MRRIRDDCLYMLVSWEYAHDPSRRQQKSDEWAGRYHSFRPSRSPPGARALSTGGSRLTQAREQIVDPERSIEHIRLTGPS
jgi:hypothetical protein